MPLEFKAFINIMCAYTTLPMYGGIRTICYTIYNNIQIPIGTLADKCSHV